MQRRSTGNATARLGVVADDLTGAADVGSLLAEAGLRVLVEVGDGTRAAAGGVIATADRTDDAAAAMVAADVTVVGLRTRTAPVSTAVEQSLAAAERLLGAGTVRLYSKICSTFDSTPRGNIGPVADALADAVGQDVTVVCPAYPAQGRTVRDRILRVRGVPLAETSMAHHPLTPMRDSDLVRLLAPQTERPVGAIELGVVDRGPEAIRAAVDTAGERGHRYVVIDAEHDAHIEAIAEAIEDDRLAVGGAALAAALGRRSVSRGAAAQTSVEVPGATGARHPGLILAGSVSSATQAQVAHWSATRPTYRLDPLAGVTADQAAAGALRWLDGLDPGTPALVASTTTPAAVAAAQARLGVEAAARWVETVLGAIAAAAVERGVERLVVAGGESSGAVLWALPTRRYLVGPTIEPGVPWLVATDRRTLAVALKSGNFGAPDFFSRALLGTADVPAASPAAAT